MTDTSERRRVLVVDDDPECREMLAAALRGAGFVVDTAADGFEALARVARAPADVLVSDVQMPGMSGVSLIRAFRQRGMRQPFVLMTGGESRDLRTAAEAYGALACLPKPIALEDLIWKVECALACVSSAERMGRLRRSGTAARS
jgi:two-component system OmpR family response regulator